jgi:hypothetical protein
MVAFAHEKDIFIIEDVVETHTLASTCQMLWAAEGMRLS